jgi:hypothetical protein
MKTKLNNIIIISIVIVIILILLFLYIKVYKTDLFENLESSNPTSTNITLPNTSLPNITLPNTSTTKAQAIDRTKIYGSLFLENLDKTIKNLSNPDIQYEENRIQLNNYSDILF